MAPYYRIVTSTSTLPLDNALLQTMEKQNQEELEKTLEEMVPDVESVTQVYFYCKSYIHAIYEEYLMVYSV